MKQFENKIRESEIYNRIFFYYEKKPKIKVPEIKPILPNM